MLFEGTEKKFEILTGPDGPDLRALGEDFWRGIVAASNATILSHVGSDRLDAWLLSESSLFVSRRWAVMITCGRTTLIDALLTLLDTVPVSRLASLVYERKNENFPGEQPSTFAEDVARLRERAPGVDVVFGDPDGDRISLFNLDRPLDDQRDEDDATLELLMHDIDESVAAAFGPAGPGGRALRDAMGLPDLLPGYRFDDHLFDPQGYSLNAVDGRSYATMHATPEREGSYVSFEMGWGLDAAAAGEAVRRLMAFFKPERADLLLFSRTLTDDDLPHGYVADRRRADSLACGYPMQYFHLVKE